jgi:AcrR family transcriptional regulator
VRERILDRALDLFNDRGVEYVGVRELARDLGVKGGNVTYHFPTKDHLVSGLVERFGIAGAGVPELPEEVSLLALMKVLEARFRLNYRYRCLFVSLPLLLRNHPDLPGPLSASSVEMRRTDLIGYIERLRSDRLLDPALSNRQKERVATLLSWAERGWVVDAGVVFGDRDPGWCAAHYLRMLSEHLLGLATPQGRAELRRYEGELRMAKWGIESGSPSTLREPHPPVD